MHSCPLLESDRSLPLHHLPLFGQTHHHRHPFFPSLPIPTAFQNKPKFPSPVTDHARLRNAATTYHRKKGASCNRGSVGCGDMETKSREEDGKDAFEDHGGQSWLRAKPRAGLSDSQRDSYLRADKIDLKSLDIQLEKRISKAWSKERVASNRPKEEWEIDPAKLRLRYEVARGTYGTVYRGYYDEQDVAVKILDWGEEGYSTEADIAATRAAFQQEVAVWHELDHPNVTKFIGASMAISDLKLPQKNPSNVEDPSLSSRACIVVVEFLSGGTLKSYLIKNLTKKLPFKIVIQLALDLARGLSYLHSKKIVHRDVKSENMLLDTNRTLKIADFGVARVEAQNPKDMTGETGTLGYMAPEVLEGKPYNRKCDVYSFGICLWEVYCCDMPYRDMTFSEASSAVVRQNLRPKIPRCCPNALENIMRRCWDANPEKRPDMDEVVRLLEAIDTSKGGGMIPEDQMNGCFCFGRTRGP